jgi:hypothetical protein
VVEGEAEPEAEAEVDGSPMDEADALLAELDADESFDLGADE